MKKFLIFLVLSLFAGRVCAEPRHAIAMHGQPKYGADFSHFDYVNPNAPKKGQLKLADFSSFDTFNPFSVMGNSAAGIGMLFETLMKSSDDEAFTQYGLIAKSIDVADDYSTVAFEIRENARFSDGSYITPEDVVFSFDILKEKGLPQYRYYYADVEKAKAVGNKVIFTLQNKQNRELPLILGQMPVLKKTYWQDKDFMKTTLDIPIGSGPYRIKDFKLNRYIIYQRDENYWGADLPVNKGFYNFDEIRYDIYRDTTVAVEAFKAGAYDVRIENEAKKWATAYEDRNENILKREFGHSLPSGMQGFVFNTRRDIFANPKVREALGYAFNFDWTNTHLFYGLYKRTTSYFDNSYLKATPLPTEQEKKLLAPFADRLDKRIFDTPINVDVFDKENPRNSYKKALDLLSDAGWQVKNGVLKNKNGEPFEFEILLDASGSSAWERITLPFVQNLKKLGIKARIRTMDALQYKTRLDHFDFDMFVMVWGQSLSPGNEQRYFWSSDAADQSGSYNYAGVRSDVVDFLIEKVVSAQTREELKTAVSALDRVLMYGFYVIPHWHIPVSRMVFWDKFAYPDKIPMQGVSLMTWWAK